MTGGADSHPGGWYSLSFLPLCGGFGDLAVDNFV
jgi:hypothetical protein